MSSRPSALAALVLLLTLPFASSAAQAARGGTGKATGASFVIDGAIEMGGDRILELTFTNGDTQDIYAGQGGTIAAGIQYRPVKLPRLALTGTLGYKFVLTAAENADIRFTRVPVELTARWDLNTDWWAGAGVVRHNAIKLDGDGFTPDVSVDPATGATVELGWRWFSLTYTAITYTDPAGQDFNGGNVGLGMRWVFGKK